MFIQSPYELWTADINSKLNAAGVLELVAAVCLYMQTQKEEEEAEEKTSWTHDHKCCRFLYAQLALYKGQENR